MADETVGIELRAIDNASGTINRVGGSLNNLGRSGGGASALGQLGGILGRGVSNATANLERYAVRLGFLAGGVGAKAVQWSIDFQKNMELLVTQAGVAADQLPALTRGVEALVGVTATAPIALSQMLYHIESVGVRGPQALNLLRVAALGVKIGIVNDFESVTNAMAAIQFSGIKGVSSFEQSMSLLTAIVGVGNMRMQDLAHSFSTGVLGTAAAYGVSIQSLGAALAVLTDAGVPPQQAMYRLGYSMTQLAAPTAAAIKHLATIGVGQFQLAKDMRKPDGIFAALSDLQAHLASHGMIVNGKLTPQGANLIARSFGGGRFSASIIQLLEMLPRVSRKYAQITGQQDQFNQKVEATQQTASYQFSQLFANMQLLGVKLGDALVPGLIKLNSFFNSWIAGNQPAIDGFISKLGSGFSAFVDKLMAVDWSAVASGLQSAAGFAGHLIDAFMSAPDWVKGLLVSGFALNKLTGGMVTNLAGFGVKQGLGTIGALLRYLPGRAGAVGGALASIGATPVYVTNWPGGFGAGGGGVNPSVLTTAIEAAGGILAPGFGALLLTALAPLAMFYLIPSLFPGNPGKEPTVTRDIGGKPFTYDNNKYGGIPNFGNLAYIAQQHGGTTINGPVTHSKVLAAEKTMNLRGGLGPEVFTGKLKDDMIAANADTHSELVRIHAAADAQKNSQDRTLSETANVRMAVDAGLGAVQGQLNQAISALYDIAAKSWQVVVTPQQVNTAGAQQAAYGPQRTRQRSQMSNRAGFGIG